MTTNGPAEKQQALRLTVVVVLLALGVWLRFYNLDQYPLGVHQDELSNIYDGYSLAETGADRFGDPHPAIVRAYGENDYRPALYPWLAAVPIKLFGFSVTSGRIPAAVLGVASLVLLYLFANAVGGPSFALIALLLGVLSPLHIQYSRIGHEAASPPSFFLILALFIWERCARRSFPLIQTALLGLVVGLSANIYQATRLTAVLLCVVIAIDIFRHARPALSRLAVLGVGALAGASPQIFVLLTDPTHFFARARVLTMPVHNPLAYPFVVLWNYWLNLSPGFLFLPRRLESLTVARLLPPEMFFFYVGLVALFFLRDPRQSRARFYVYAAMVIAILPSALSTGNPDALRASGMAILTPLFSAAGVVYLYQKLSPHRRLRKAYYPLVTSMMLLSSAVLVYRYSRSVYFRENNFQYFLVKLDSLVGRYQRDFEAVLVERYGSERYLYITAFTGMTPREFQLAHKRLYSEGMDQFTRVGKYYLVSSRHMQPLADTLSQRSGRFLFVSSRKLAGLRPIDSVSFQQEKSYLLTR